MQRLLILSSAAILITGCSMQGQGTYYDTSASSCSVGNCASGSTYSVGGKPAHYGQQTHQSHAQAPSYAGHHGGQHSRQAQQPSAHAYGTQVQSHQAYAGGHHGAPALRGRHNVRQAYKYGTLGAVMYDVDSDLYGVQGRVGYQSANYWGTELEGSIGVKGDSETVGTATAKLDVDYQVGAFAVARAPIGEQFSIFARGGYAATRLGAELNSGGTITKNSETFDGFAYGVGGEYAVNNRDSIRLDYTRYDFDDLNGQTDSFALSYARKF